MPSTLDISVNSQIYTCIERTVDPSLLATWIVNSTWEWLIYTKRFLAITCILRASLPIT